MERSYHNMGRTARVLLRGDKPAAFPEPPRTAEKLQPAGGVQSQGGALTFIRLHRQLDT